MTPKTSDYTTMSGPELLQAVGLDGMKWAEALVQIAEKRMGEGVSADELIRDKDWLLGWFANAIEQTKIRKDSEHRRRGAEACAALIASADADILAAIERLTDARVEWGTIGGNTDANQVDWLAEDLRRTRERFDLGDEARDFHGVYLAGTEVVVCYTGNSPNSAAHARLITGLINSAPVIADALKAHLVADTKPKDIH